MRISTIVFLLFSSLACVGQTELTQDMQTTLRKMQLEYLQPVEEQPIFLKKGKIKYFKYDFGMEINDGKTLILVQTKRDVNYLPQVMVPPMISTLATNHQDVEIRIMQPTDTYLKESNCDWAIEALFSPKENIGEYQIAYLKSIFKEGVGATNILYLAVEEIKTTPVLRYKN